MIHVCYGLYDRDGRYSKFAGTSILSLLENTSKEVTIHLLHDNTLSFENRSKFNAVVDKYNQQIKFYNVETLAVKDVEEIKDTFKLISNTRFSMGTLYRLLIPKLLAKSITKVIYLDADIIVNCNINNLWNVDLADYPLAAVPEFANGLKFELGKYLIAAGIVKSEDYMNAGVLLLNLEKLRNDKEFKRGKNFIREHPQCIYFDQDFLNYCFSKNYLKLPMDFNTFVDVERVHRQPCKIKSAIYHFLSNSFQANTNDVFNRMYLEYFIKTPWFDLDMIDNIFKAFTFEHDNQMMNIVNMSIMASTRRRIFFVTENNMQAIKDIFAVTKDELLINASPEDAIKELISKISDLQNKMMLFVFVKDYLNTRIKLINAGFKEGIDFVDGSTLLTTKHGMQYMPNFLIRNM